jgi:hypothetical protein
MKTVTVWGLAILITLAAVVYQRLIGPTRPVRGTATFDGIEIAYRLSRSHSGPADHLVRIPVQGAGFSGEVHYHRYRVDEPTAALTMERDGDDLIAALPHQPPGGKLVYQVFLTRTVHHGGPGGGEARETTRIGLSGPVVIRFSGGVPSAILLSHAILMFLAMLGSNRAGLEALRRGDALRRLTLWTLVLLVLGGLILGPLVQWYAFGEFWTGFPNGHDLTDNKTLIAALAWLAAALLVRRRGVARAAVIVAAIVTLAIFSIPHSVMGTELDYSQLPDAPPAAGP